MRYTWHEPKRQSTLVRLGLDFALAEHVFAGPTFTFEDDRRDYGEERWVTLGMLRGKVVVIVHTETEDEIHVISMREAERDEQRLFFADL
jgi:uncharacterized protein